MSRIITALIISVLSFNFVYSQLYHQYCNARFDFCGDYPTNFEGLGEAQNGDGQIFVSKDKKSEIRIYGNLVIEDLQDLKINYKQILASKNTTYRLLKEDYFVVSGFEKNGEIFYIKTVKTKTKYFGREWTDVLLTTMITYPKSQKNQYSGFCQHIAKTFGVVGAISQPTNAYIEGDFDGNQIIDFATVTLIKKGEGNPVENGTADDYEIQFSEPSLKPIEAECCEIRLINEGDLNNDGADDISVFQAPMNGCTYSMTTYFFTNKEWKPIVNTFLIPTGCAHIGDEDLQQRVFRENDSIYYLEADMSQENGKLIKNEVEK